MKLDRCALVLEGGGIKCAYQLGSLIALKEAGFNFVSITGSSFGALNGAIYLKGGTETLFNFYNNINVNDIYIDQETRDFVTSYNGDKDNFSKAMLSFIKGNPSYLIRKSEMSNYYHNFVMKQVDVNAILDSPIELIVTVLEVNNNPLVIGSLFFAFAANKFAANKLYESGQIKGHYINLKEVKNIDIPRYVAGSANYPTFSPIFIEGKYYLDGGIYNNTPYEHYIDKDYDKIVIIRTNTGVLEDFPYQNPNILLIEPKSSLGSSMMFTHDNAIELIKRGYSETMEKLQR